MRKLLIFLGIITSLTIAYAYNEYSGASTPDASKGPIVLIFNEGKENEYKEEVNRDKDLLKTASDLANAIINRLQKISSEVSDCEGKNPYNDDFVDFLGKFANLSNSTMFSDCDYLNTSCQKLDCKFAVQILAVLKENIKNAYSISSCSDDSILYRNKVREVEKYIVEDFLDLIIGIQRNKNNLPYYKSYKENSAGASNSDLKSLANTDGIALPSSRNVEDACPESETSSEATSALYKAFKSGLGEAYALEWKLNRYKFESYKANTSNPNLEVAENFPLKNDISPWRASILDPTTGLNEGLNFLGSEDELLKEKDVREFDSISAIENYKKEDPLLTRFNSEELIDIDKQKEEYDKYLLSLRDYYADKYRRASQVTWYNLFKQMEIQNLLVEDTTKNMQEFNSSLTKLLNEKQCINVPACKIGE